MIISKLNFQSNLFNKIENVTNHNYCDNILDHKKKMIISKLNFQSNLFNKIENVTNKD